MRNLNEQELRAAAGMLPGWEISSGGLVREVKLEDFVAALAFVNRVGVLAEAAGHHPDIDIRYNRVKLGLVTHDAGGVTEADLRMAERLTEEINDVG